MDVTTIQIRVDDTKANQQVDAFDKKLSNVGGGGKGVSVLGGAFGKLQSQIIGASGSAAGFLGKLGSFGAAGAGVAVVTAAFAAAYIGIKKLADSVSELKDLSSTMDASTDSVQAYMYVMQRSGIEQEQAASIAVKFNKALQDLREGADTAVDAFGRVGLSAKSFKGLDFAASIDLYAKAFANASDKGLANSSVLDVLGNKGAKAKDALKDLAENGLASTTAELEKQGSIIREDTIQAMDELSKRLGSVWSNGYKEWQKNSAEFVQDNKDTLGELVTVAEAAASTLAKVFSFKYEGKSMWDTFISELDKRDKSIQQSQQQPQYSSRASALFANAKPEAPESAIESKPFVSQEDLNNQLALNKSRVESAATQIKLADDLLQYDLQRQNIAEQIALIEGRIATLSEGQTKQKLGYEKEIQDLTKQSSQIEVDKILKQREIAEERKNSEKQISDLQAQSAAIQRQTGNAYLDSISSIEAIEYHISTLVEERNNLNLNKSSDVKRDLEIQVELQRAQNDIVAERVRMELSAKSYAKSLNTAGGAQRRYDESTSQIADARSRGAISEDEARIAQASALEDKRVALREAANERIRNGDASLGEAFKTGVDNMSADWGNAQTRMADAAQSLGNSLESGLTDAFMSIIDGTKSAGEAFESFALSIISSIAKIMVQQMIAIPIANALMGALGMSVGGAAAGVGHSGGFVGQIPQTRRFHNGGVVGDEVGVIAKRGERIMSVEEQQKAANSKSGGKGNVQIMNVFDTAIIDQHISSNPDVIINVIANNQDRVKAMLQR